MIEFIVLLLPVAVVYGWFMGYGRAMRDSSEKHAVRSKNIASGVRYLLTQKSKAPKAKASDILVKILEGSEGDSFDAGIALAQVYRSQGEIDKAIAIHKAMLAGKLSSAEHDLATLELSRDLIKFSLFDNASVLLQELLKGQRFISEACILLIKIHQQLCEWDSAISLVDRYRRVLPKHYSREVYSHFLCEKAQRALLSREKSTAVALFKSALSSDPSSVRAMTSLAGIYLSDGLADDALEELSEIPSKAPDMIMFAVPELRKCYSLPADNERYLNVLEKWSVGSSSADLITEIAELKWISSQDEAFDYLLMQMRNRPSLKLLSKLMEFQIRNTDEPNSKAKIGFLMSLVNAEIAKINTYNCVHCGFATRIMFWHCPKCGEWNTIKPVQGFEGD